MATATDPSPSPDFVLSEALRHQAMGFHVFSVWGVHDDGTCWCREGPACDQQGKHPIPPNGFHAASADPERIRTMLSVASHPNYGIVWPTDREPVIEWDVDGESWPERMRELKARLGPLPPTKTTTTPSGGRHVFYRWPAIVEPPAGLGHVLGFVTRWPGQGYVVGPGSHDHRGAWVDTSKVDDIATLPKEWALAAVAEARPALRVVASSSDALITMRPGGDYEVPERVRASESRYEAIRSYVAHLYNFGLTEDEMWSLVVSKLAPVFEEPLDEARLRSRFQRAVRGMAERLGPPASTASTVSREASPEEVTEKVKTTGVIWLPAGSYITKHEGEPEYCSPLAVFGDVSFLAGPPKVGKTTLAMGLLWARTTGKPYLWGEAVPTGPSLYLTEEYGKSVAMKLDSGLDLDVLDHEMFGSSGLRSRAELLALLSEWYESKHTTDQPLVFGDTFALWSGIKDENDAVETMDAIARFREWAGPIGCAFLFGAHTRKGGGDAGEGIRGSSSIFGQAGIASQFAYRSNPMSDLRTLVMSGRYGPWEQHVLDFDRDEGTYSLAEFEPGGDVELSSLPTTASGAPGLTHKELGELWRMTEGSARNKALKLWKDDLLVRRMVPRPGRGPDEARYWRRELLSLDPASGSVGERMGDIFGGSE